MALLSADLVLLPVGVVVGVFNTVAGGGMIVSFPVWLALGYSPFVANVSNTIGVFPSNFGGVWSYRERLANDRALAVRIGVAAGLGSATGAAILLSMSEAAFEGVVPYLIAGASLLMLFQPQLVRFIRRWTGEHHGDHRWATVLVVYVASIYGGYFGATMGVILLAVLGLTLTGGMQRFNALKNSSALVINTVGVLLFATLANVAWTPALLQAVGTLVGGFLGGRLAQRLPERLFRAVVVTVGFGAAIAVAAG